MFKRAKPTPAPDPQWTCGCTTTRVETSGHRDDCEITRTTEAVRNLLGELARNLLGEFGRAVDELQTERDQPEPPPLPPTPSTPLTPELIDEARLEHVARRLHARDGNSLPWPTVADAYLTQAEEIYAAFHPDELLPCGHPKQDQNCGLNHDNKRICCDCVRSIVESSPRETP